MKKYVITLFTSLTILSTFIAFSSTNAAVPGQATVSVKYGPSGNCRVGVQVPTQFVKHNANIYIGNKSYTKSSSFSSYGASIYARYNESVSFGYKRSY